MSKRHPIQLTMQRQAVLEAVQEAGYHIDASAVFQKVRQSIPRISLGTVYRSLSALRDAGLLHEIINNDGPTLYDGNLHPHQHLVCRACGKVVDLILDLPVPLLEQAAQDSGFISVESSRVDFHGICKDCEGQPLPPGKQTAS